MYGHRDECPALGCAVDLPENWSQNETTKQKSFSQGAREGSVAIDAHGMGKVRDWSQMAHERNALQGNCNTLQRTSTRCNTHQHAATHCNTLQMVQERNALQSHCNIP